MDGQDFSGKQAGPYIFSSLLGLGASGSVYQAVGTKEEDSPSYAASKMLNHDTVISCPHVMMLHDYFAYDGYFFLVMPLYGIDMFKAIWDKKLYWRRDALIREVIVEILEGVSACHKQGIYHRDLKPENIMCDADGKHVKITDFGLSTKRQICSDGGCGTSPYMSPECWDEKGTLYHADLLDIWSLGVILFNMVTCRYPWEESRPTDKEYTAFLSNKDHLLHTTPISGPLSDLLYEMWHPNPFRRPSIPAIKRAILVMDTFYKPRRPNPTAPLSLSMTKYVIDSQKMRVAPVEDEKNKSTQVWLLCNAIDKAPALGLGEPRVFNVRGFVL